MAAAVTARRLSMPMSKHRIGVAYVVPRFDLRIKIVFVALKEAGLTNHVMMMMTTTSVIISC